MNYEKSKNYGLNLPTRLLRTMSRLTAISVENLPNSYLGLLFIQGGHIRNLWDKIKAKLSLKMTNWKPNWLSSTSRLVKIKSILSSMPIFWLGVFWLPLNTLLEMEHLMRDFLWKGNSEENKIHLVSWDLVYSDVNKGRLGIRSLRTMNTTLLRNLLWPQFPLE